jgi:pimeloyl-ACP methyl ester carboxylesterase
MFKCSSVPVICLSLMIFFSGCNSTMPDRDVRMTRSYIYYLDGAGGGGLISNWSRGLRQGLSDAGYTGAGEMFRWETGLGVVADQDSSVDYKRGKAAECARRLRQYTQEHPNAPVSIIGLSAGTAVAAFTLESLPQNCQVGNVIFLGASISSDYDMTKALRRVRNRLYVFTSEQDAVLAFLVPMSGTADRQTGSQAAGLSGFRMPARGYADMREQYAKISYIRWRPEFESYGNLGGHTDAVKAPFVQAYIAPLIMQASAHRIQPEAGTASRMIRNPDYDRWVRFNPGSQTVFEGYQRTNGVKQRVRLIAKLVSKHEDTLVVERTYVSIGYENKQPVRVQNFFVQAWIRPQDHPLSSPDAEITRLNDKQINVGDRSLTCIVKTFRASGEFPEWGRNVNGRVAMNSAVPGGAVQVYLKAHKKNQPYEFDRKVMKFVAF